MSDLIKMLEHQAKLFNRQGAGGLYDLLWNSKLKIEQLEQQLKQQWVSVDITDIRIDSVVKLRSGDTGVVFGIYDVITDGVNGGVAAARFFIRLDNNKGEQYHTHRKDGVSYAKSRGDIIEIKPPTK